MHETVTHVAGPLVQINGRGIQRCACCGEKLRDSAEDLSPTFEYWIQGSLVRFEGETQVHAGSFIGGTLPEDFCLALVE